MGELAYTSAAELARKIKGKQLSPVEVMDYFIQRIEERNASLNAVVSTNYEYAREEALKLEQKLAAGEVHGDFAGVPTLLKDFLPGKPGWKGTFGGIRALSESIDPGYSNYAKNMEIAGAIVIGKTNSPSMAYRGTCDNYMYGPTGTPFNPAYNSGGSSGGSAAAVADGMIPVAEGTDGGGSIRIPAAWCGLYGYKASVGTIPSVSRPDAFGDTHPYCFDGALTRTVEDSAMVLNQMAYFDPRDPFSIEYPRRNFLDALKQPIKEWKIAFTEDFNTFPVDSEVAEIVRRAAYRLEEAGAIVEPVKFNIRRDHYELAEAWSHMINITTVNAFERMKRSGIDLLGEHRNDMPPELAAAIETAYRENYIDYGYYDQVRTEIYDALQDVFDKYDLIISPTVACHPVLNAADGNTLGPESINGDRVERLIGYCMTYFMNFTGHPAASVPAGLSKEGFPVGMQIIGQRYHDFDVLAASAAFEQIQPWKEIYRIPAMRKL